MKRDQKRKQEFLAKKAASAADVKKEVIVVVEAEKATSVDPVDEILLTEIPAGPRPDIKLWKVVIYIDVWKVVIAFTSFRTHCRIERDHIVCNI